MENIRYNFANPPASFGPTPFWAVNENMDPDSLEKSLLDLKAKSMAGVIIHPRTGLEIDYLSDDFWKGMDFIVDTLERIGMSGWIYDEYNWPSGIMGGKLLKEHPEYRQKGLDYKIVKSGASVDFHGCVVAAFDMDDNLRRLTVDDNVKTYSPPSGVSRALVFYEKPMLELTFAATCAPWAGQEAGMIDYLNPDAVRYFMEHTHHEYARRYSRHFGKTLLGVFTDEPQNHQGLIWTADLPEEFKRRAGYDLMPVLHRLTVDSPESAGTRIDYYRVASELYKERYFDAVGRWCGENGLIFTGHLSAEDYPSLLPANHGSVFMPLSAMQMPGVDWLGLGHGMSDKPTLAEKPNLNPKLLSSIAHVMGRERCLVEIWGGGGWDATPAKMKPSLDWLLAGGVNFINPHLVWVSAKGFRKRDFPPTFTPIAPWWTKFAPFSKYIARLSYLLSRGVHRARILLLFPTVEMWATHQGRGDHPKPFDAIVESLRETTDLLLSNQHDFDYLFDEALDHYTIGQGFVEAGAEKFDTIVVPPLSGLQNSTREWITRAIGAGVRVMEKYSSSEDLIEELDEKSPSAIQIRGLIARRMMSLRREIDGANVFFIANLSGSDGRVVVRLRGMAGKRLELWNPDDGRILACADSREDGDDVVIVHHFEPGASVVFACIDGEKRAGAEIPVWAESKPWGAAIELHTKWECSLADKNLHVIEPWAVETGSRKVRSLAQMRHDNRYTARSKAVMSLARGVVKMFDPIVRPEKHYRFERFFDFGGTGKIKPVAEKILGVSFDKMSIYEATEYMSGLLDYIPARTVGGVSFPPTGEQYRMTARFDVGSLPADLEIIYEDLAEPVTITINGKPAPLGVPVNVWDKCNRAVSVSQFVKIGANEIVFESRMPDFPALFPCLHAPEIVALRGTFFVIDGVIKAGVPDVKPGKSWTHEGLKNYNSEVIYARNVELAAAPARAELDLGDVRDVVEVWVNGHHAGERLWGPYRFAIGDMLVAGRNRIEIRVRATASNLFGKPRDSGLLDFPKIII